MSTFTNWYDNGQYGYMGFGPMPDRRITLTITYDAQEGPFYCGQAASWGICAYDPLDKTRYAVYLGNPLNEVYTDGVSYMLVNVSHQTVTADITTNPSDWEFHGGLTSVEGCALCIITYTGSGMTTGTSPCGSDFAAIDSRFTGCFTYEINTTRFAYLIDDCPIYAKRAECDQYGDNIEQTYLKKADETPQVQSDWTQADNTLPSYILHKPDTKPLVAGKGVRIVDDYANNRYVVEADETVLWENSSGKSPGTTDDFPITLSEDISHFERVKFYWQTFNSSYNNHMISEKMTDLGGFVLEGAIYNSSNDSSYSLLWTMSVSGTTLSHVACKYNNWANNTVSGGAAFVRLYKVVGVNRVSGN